MLDCILSVLFYYDYLFTFVCTGSIIDFFFGCGIEGIILSLFLSQASLIMSGISKLPGTRHGAFFFYE